MRTLLLVGGLLSLTASCAARLGARPRTAAPGPVRVEPGAATCNPCTPAGLDKAPIRRSLQARCAALRACVAGRHPGLAPLRGDETITFTIAAGGAATKVGIRGVADPGLVGCATRVLARAPFPTVRGVGAVYVSYPLGACLPPPVSHASAAPPCPDRARARRVEIPLGRPVVMQAGVRVLFVGIDHDDFDDGRFDESVTLRFDIGSRSVTRMLSLRDRARYERVGNACWRLAEATAAHVTLEWIPAPGDGARQQR